ncbi:hypothetical protein [Rhizobium phage RHph_I40]|uniref:Uncharacterized protein n=1 Tax=Rhizobium phage RHph_I38 TaxID=2509734 RepID=A0A7S5UWD2_9CAUD|nr:hypothetical protein EVC01_006 [Rhizobium phage RHph_I38]QXV73635.1 hypothetical protein [Rhizobium phage RHph_I40]
MKVINKVTEFLLDKVTSKQSGDGLLSKHDKLLDAHAKRMDKVHMKHRKAKDKLYNQSVRAIDKAHAYKNRVGTIVNQELDALDAQMEALKARKADVIGVGETVREQSEDQIKHLLEVRAKIAGVQLSGV